VARHSAPKPFRSHRASTVFLRAPGGDWSKIKLGVKREFRLTGSALLGLQCPTPVVVYTNRNGQYEQVVMVLEATWRETLGAISPASLEAEGFPSVAHFRRYWMGRTKRRFRPLDTCSVYRVRPWRDSDEQVMGMTLLNRLYGEFLGGVR
jgi:hypothetical protein